MMGWWQTLALFVHALPNRSTKARSKVSTNKA
jgi:hypothetical protein